MVTNFKYTNIAFISYKREDEAWAKWLQKKIEHYKLPIEIRKIHPNLEFSERPRHIFKDTTDLSGGVLAKAIKAGLDSSKFLIVICSPRAAKSEWVCKEVQEFIDSGREEYIIPFIIEGEPHAKNKENECFPSTLKSLAGERELLGINVNENGREAASVKVAARMFGLSYDSLWQRFKREEKKRKRSIIAAFILAIIVLLSIIAYGAWMNHRISLERDRTNIANKQLFSANLRINKQRDELQKANDSITKQKTDLQVAFDKLSKTEVALLKSNMDLVKSNNNLQNEKQNVLKANKNILIQRSVEYGNLAYNYIEEGKISEAEDLLHKIIPDNKDQYVYTPEMERALRRYCNYLDRSGVKLIENKDLIGSYIRNIPSDLGKYDFKSTTKSHDEIDLPNNKEGVAVFNNNKDTLLVLNNEYDNSFLSTDENMFVVSKYNNIYIWDINNKSCVCKEKLGDGIRDVKFINGNRLCILGEKYFSIYKINNNILELENQTKILRNDSLWEKKYGKHGNVPFCCDYENNRIIYQREDSCLIVQQIGQNNIIVDKKIDGIVESIAFNSDFLLAITYSNENEKNLYQREEHLEILHYHSLWDLYNKVLYGYTLKLEFSPTKYLSALVNPIRYGTTKLYIWDVSNIVKPSCLFNLSKTISIKQAYRLDNIKMITDDGSVLYVRKNRKSQFYDLCITDLLSNYTDTLYSGKYGYSIEAKSSLDGKYIVFSEWDKGVWLYDRKNRQKIKMSSDEFISVRSVSISSDGSTIAFRAFRKIGDGVIIVCKTKTGDKKQYSLIKGMGLNLNYNGTRLMLEDENGILYDYDLKTLNQTFISSPVGAFHMNEFGYSKSGKYLYKVYESENFNDEHKKNYYIKVWTSDKHELIMENVIESPTYLFFDDTQNLIFRTSNDSEIIPFERIENLIKMFIKDYNKK